MKIYNISNHIHYMVRIDVVYLIVIAQTEKCNLKFRHFRVSIQKSSDCNKRRSCSSVLPFTLEGVNVMKIISTVGTVFTCAADITRCINSIKWFFDVLNEVRETDLNAMTISALVTLIITFISLWKIAGRVRKKCVEKYKAKREKISA